MPVRQYANAPATTLASACTSGATSIVVTSVTGLPITFPYTLIIDRGLSTEEAVSVTGSSGTTLTVSRGIDGTTAFAHSSSAVVVHGITAQDIREANAHVNASSAVHGLAGSVVGTSDTQTLTNKTLSVDSNTVSGIAASSFVLSNASGNIDGSAAQKAVPSGTVVGTTDTQTLTNKTLTAPTINGGTFSSGTTNGGTFTSGTVASCTVTGSDLTHSGNTFPWVIKKGSGVLTLAAIQVNTLTVNFGFTFASAPNVQISVGDERFAVGVASVTTTNFQLRTYYIPGAPVAGAGLAYSWLAVL